jgi:hypothetical protein
MRQKALRASRTCGSHKGHLEAVRHSQCSRPPQKPRASGTDGHHLIHLKIPLPRPLPFTTNRRALFSWSRWDGRLWETTALWAYHKSQFVHVAKRTQDSLRSAQTQLLERPVSGTHFWHTHYTNVHIANQSMHDFYLLIHETTAIKFILKTSPMKIQKRMYHTIAALDSGSFQIWLHVNLLHTLRTIWAHRTNNPLHFKAAVGRERRTAVARHMLEKHQTFEKSVRTDRKHTFGQDWLLHSKVRYPLPKDHFEPDKASFVVTCDACPQRWTTEPLLHIIDLICGKLNSCLKSIEDFLNANRQTLSMSVSNQDRILLRTMSVCSWDLSLLAQEFVALRYYRLHHFPSSFQNKEIQIWKQFWLRTFALADVEATEGKDYKAQSPVVKIGKTHRTWLPETYKARLIREESRAIPSKGIEDKTMLRHKEDGLDKDSSLRTLEISRPARQLTNSQGQISWIRWDRQELYIGSTIAYKESLIVLGANHARAKMKAIQRHAPEHMPYDIDTVRISHHRSLWHVNLRLRPFLELVVSLSAITFLVRTAPAGIRDRLVRHVQVIELLNYDVGLDLEVLRKLQFMLALRPQSPLLFLDYVKTFKTTSASRLLLGQWLTGAKSHRLNAKVVSGPAMVLKSKYLRSKKEDHTRRAQLLLKSRSVESWTWRSERPFAIVAPFRGTVTRMMGGILSTLRQCHRHMKEPYIRNSRWARPLMTIRRAFACTRQISFLIDDLAVLRYYRMQHYPESVSETALRLDQAFADAKATDEPSSTLKVPKPSQKSVRGKAKHPIRQAFGHQRTSRKSKSSETRSKPQIFLAGNCAKSRTRIAPSHGVDEKNHQFHQHRLLKISQSSRPHSSEKGQTDIKPVLSIVKKNVSRFNIKKSGPRLKHQR